MLLTLCVLLPQLLASTPSTASGFGVVPPEKPPLEERVRAAAHIFVGRAERLRVLDARGRPVVPEPVVLTAEQQLEVSVRVEDVLKSRRLHVGDHVRIRFGRRSPYNVGPMRLALVDPDPSLFRVYLTRDSSAGKDILVEVFRGQLFQQTNELRRINELLRAGDHTK